MGLQSPYEAIIFDLDGTLIDSAPGILGSFAEVLAEAGIEPLMPLSEKLIGPPLRETLAALTGIDSPTELERLAAGFRDAYDTAGYRESRVYEGVEDMLAGLHDKKITMAIATNKRRKPTLKILEHLGWRHYFRLVGTLDMSFPPLINKGCLLGSLLKEMGTEAGATLYMGDKEEDGEAALANMIPFLVAGWGYGEWHGQSLQDGWRYLHSPVEMLDI